MLHGRYGTIEGRNELRLKDTVVDVRSTEQRMKDWISQPKNFAKTMMCIGFIALVMPMLLVLLLLPMIIVADTYTRALKYLPIRYPAWSGLADPGQLHPGKDTPEMATGIMYMGVVDAQDPYERGKHVLQSADDLTRHMLVLGTTGSGKAQPLTAKVHTPSGWRLMGDLKVGDLVSTPDGAAAPINAVYPQGVKDIYRFTFADGRQTEACAEHLWSVLDKRDPITKPQIAKVISTAQLLKAGDFLQEWYAIAVPEAIEKPAQSLAIDPFVMGKTWRQHGHEHSIPENYLNGSIEQRQMLLCGFLKAPKDTFQNNRPINTYTVVSISEMVATQVVDVVRSLGGSASIEKDNHQKYSKVFSSSWIVHISLARNLQLSIISIEPIGQKEAQCIHIDDPKHLYITDDYVVTHNSEFLKGMTLNVLCWASGFFIADAKADNKLPTDMYSQARMFARDYDFLVVNYLLGGNSPAQIANMRERMSNGLQPATAADADTLVQMTSNMMVKASGDGKSWQERGLNLFRGITRALCYKRDMGELTLSMDVLREYLSLEKIEELYIEGYKMADEGQKPWPSPFLGVKSYLEVGLPGFKTDIMLKKFGFNKEEEEDMMVGGMGMGRQPAKKPPATQSNETFNQHGYRSDQVYPALSLLIDTYAHIFRRRYPEVDMQDVVINKRICVSLIPSLEKGAQEQESLGKLNLALLRVMMARALGSSVEGDVKVNVDAKITASDTPFALFLDEFAYQFAEGIALTAAQARSLNFFLCALAQDLEKLTEGDRAAEAGAMMANQAMKYFMKIVGSDKTHELAQKTLGEAMVPVLNDYERQSDFLSSVRRGQNYRVEKKARVDREVLESLNSGFAAFCYRQQAHMMRTFYVTPAVPRVRFPRINRFLQVPDTSMVELLANSIDRNPSKEKRAIDDVLKVLNGQEMPEYSNIITSDVIESIAGMADKMNPEVPAIERGIVLYQAGIEALNRAKTSDSILGKTSGTAQPVKPQQPAGEFMQQAGVATDELDQMMAAAAFTSNTMDAAAAVTAASGAAQTSTDAEATSSSGDFGLDFFNNFNPQEAMQEVTIVKKTKAEVFPDLVTVPLPGPSSEGIVPSDADTVVDDDDESQTQGEMQGDHEIQAQNKTQGAENQGIVLGDLQEHFNHLESVSNLNTVATTHRDDDSVEQKPTVKAQESQIDELTRQLAMLSGIVVDPAIVERMGDEVVGLRQNSMEGLVDLQKSLGSNDEEAEEAAATTQKAVSASLSTLDGNQINPNATEIDILFGQLEGLIK